MKHTLVKVLTVLLFTAFLTPYAYSQSFDDLLKKVDAYYESYYFEEALVFSEKALSKAEEEFGKESIQYAAALEKRGLIYMIYGNYESAEKTYLSAVDILDNKNAKGVSLYGKLILNLAQLYSYMGDFSKAENTFTKSNEINKNIHGENSIEYSESLYRTAAMYFDFYKYSLAEKTYIKALESINRSNVPNYDIYTQILDDMAVMYEEQNKTENMIPILRDLMDFTLKTKGKEHPDYKFYLIRTAEIYFKTGRENEAGLLISEAISSDIDGIKNTFYYLSEADKLFMIDFYLKNADLYYSFALEKCGQDNSVMNEITNFRLMTKALVLFSTNGLKKRILSNDDLSVKKLYEELLEIKTLLSKSYTMTKEESERKEINVKELENRAKEIERNLGTLSEYFKSDRDSYEVNWENIRNSLNDGETAVDFIDFTDIKKGKEDTIYCAIIIKKEFEYPGFIKLCRKSELERILNRGNKEEAYVKNTEANKSLYPLIWKPLDSFIGNSKVVYVSPSGLLNKVSFHAISTEGNTYLIDKYDIIYKGNLKEIINKENDQKKGQGSTAVIFGGLLYDVEPSVMSENSVRMRNYNSVEFENNRSIIPSTGTDIERGGGWKYLKGTVTESDEISDILNRNNINTKLRKGAEGNEEAFKSLSGNNSPYIIHLATHGFFFPEPDNDNPGNRSFGKPNDIFRYSINPMFRSGIVLSGANNIWKKGEKTEGMEDGVVTAFEVSDMNLSGTELVVLSACESGLGDLKGGEGVFGLQRAFKIAGAKNLIVSLWKVPDKETAELMELFYANLADSKMTIRDSFSKAQKDLRDKYPDPYVWAAFILM